MASTPVRKARRDAAAAACNLPAIEKTNRRPPPDFRSWPPGQKFEFIFNTSLEAAADVLAWKPDELDAHRLATWRVVVQSVMHLGGKFILSRMRANDTAEALETVARRLREHDERQALQRSQSAGSIADAESVDG